MSPVRGAGGDDHYADRNQPGRDRAAAAALGADDDAAERATPDVFDAPLDELKTKLSDMTSKLGSLVDKDDEPDVPVAEQADIEIDDPAAAAESSGMARLAGRTAGDEADEPDEPASAADRVALSLGADDEAPDATDEAFEAPDMLGERVLQANLDGDVNDNGIMDKFEDDIPADDDTDGDDDSGLEFASLDFDGD